MKIDPPPLPPETPGPRPAPQARDADDLRLLQRLAASHSMFGRHATAVAFLDLAAWIRPEDPRTLELRAMIEMRRGDLAAAGRALAMLRAEGCRVSADLAVIERRLSMAS